MRGPAGITEMFGSRIANIIIQRGLSPNPAISVFVDREVLAEEKLRVQSCVVP